MRLPALVLGLLLSVLGYTCAIAQEPGDKPDLPQLDTSDTTIKAYTDGKSLAPYVIALHKEPKAGQYWETGSDSFDIESRTRWQVTRVDGKTALIEQRVSMSAEMFKSDYVLAYRVDLKPEKGAPVVTKAWIGKPGGKPQVIQVAEVPKADPTDDKDADEEDREAKAEGQPFEALKLAGATWKGLLYTHEFDDMTTRIWVVENGWFDRIAKTTAGDDYEVKLQSFGYDAEALLLWPEKWQEAGAESVEDQPTEESPDDADKQD